LLTQYLKSEAGAAWPVFWTLSLIFDSHPPSGFRALTLDWESNFITPVPLESRVDLMAFNAMKSRLKYLDEQDAQKTHEERGKKGRAARKSTSQPTPLRIRSRYR